MSFYKSTGIYVKEQKKDRNYYNTNSNNPFFALFSVIISKNN